MMGFEFLIEKKTYVHLYSNGSVGDVSSFQAGIQWHCVPSDTREPGKSRLQFVDMVQYVAVVSPHF